MGVELVARGSQSLPPIQTRVIDAKPLKEDPPPESTSNEEVECVTPMSEQHAVKPALVCPPAPRKPRPAKRKLGPPPNGYYPVPSDLASIFLPLSCPLVNKKIRIG